MVTTVLNEMLLAVDEADEDCSDGGPPPDVIVGDRMTIRTDNGSDAIKVGFTSIGSQLVIFSGAGNDQIVTGRGPIRGVHGPGECEGEASGVTVAAMDEGGEHDDDGGGKEGGRPVDVRVASQTRINVGPGDDFLMLRNIQTAGDLSVSSHPGSVQIGTQNLRSEGDTVVASGGGNDDFAILDSRFAGSVALEYRPG